MPAIAADANLEQDVKKVDSAYIDAFNKQDAAGIAARVVHARYWGRATNRY
jgi:hypothetical protein